MFKILKSLLFLESLVGEVGESIGRCWVVTGNVYLINTAQSVVIET